MLNNTNVFNPILLTDVFAADLFMIQLKNTNNQK